MYVRTRGEPTTTGENTLSGILVVDDHPVIAKACGLVLEPIGAEKIISAHDVDTGYQAFVEHEALAPA